MLSSSVYNGLSIFNEVLLLMATITSICLLIPQTIKLHKNKYADNSSIGIYIIYLVSGIVWVTYASIFLFLRYNDPSEEQGSTLVNAMLWTQLVGDIISLSIGTYSLILKIHYSQSRKHNHKDENVEALIIKRSQYRNFIDSEKQYVISQLNVLYNLYTELCLKVTKSDNADQLKAKIDKSSTVEVCVIVTNILEHLFHKNKECTYRVSNDFYQNYLNQVKQHIENIKQQHADVVYRSNHYHEKNNLENITKEQRLALNYQSYMSNINLVAAYSYLCEIYQNFLNI